jgi:hypothetical protein
MVEKIEKIEFTPKKRGTLYKTGSQYTAKENITKGEAKSQVLKTALSIQYRASS